MTGTRTWPRTLLTLVVALSLSLPGIAGGAPEEPSAFAFGAANASGRLASGRSKQRGHAAEDTTGTVRLAVKPAETGVDALKKAGPSMGFTVGRAVPRTGWTRVDVPARAADAIAHTLVERGLASKVERDIRTFPAAVPNDPSFGSMWGLDNTGQTDGTVDADIDAPEAWDVETGSSSVIVAVCDTGVQLTHPDLAGNAWVNPAEIPNNNVDDDGNGLRDDVNGWDWVHNNKTVYDASDGDQHGTHVAGTIGAVGDNGVGVTGVNQDVSIMALKTIGPAGGSLLDAAEAITYAVDHGATVINHSWTAAGTITALDTAIAYASAHGVINVAAAGNEGTSNDEIEYYPASYSDPNVLGVAATDDDDVLPWWSDWGAQVDLAAPGSSIYSTLPNGYGSMSGTSMAAPHVTGAVAILRAAFPTASAAELRARLLETVDRPMLDHGPYDRVSSDGRLNLAAALAPAIAATPAIVTPAPGDVLGVSSNAMASWTPSPFTSSAAIYELQAGVQSTEMSAGFETGVTGWTDGGHAPFLRTSEAAHSGAYGMMSGTIADNEFSVVRTTVTVPPGGGTLSFWYWLDSEDTYDIACLYIDGVDSWGMNHDRPWTRTELPLSGGAHVLEWVYAKDESYSEGLDAFALDDVEVTAWDWGTTSSTPAGATSGTFTVPSETSERVGLRVRAVLAGQASGWAQVSGLRAADASPPSAPTGLTATPLDRAVDLTWDDATEPDVGSWQVWRATGTGAFSLQATVASPAYHDSEVINGTQYRYRLIARDEGGNTSEPSSFVDVTPADAWPPLAPTGLLAVKGQGRITLDWDDAPEPDVVGWEVWRAVDSGVAAEIAVVSASSYEDLTLPSGSAYSYEVVALDDDGNRSPAATVSDIPLDLQPPSAPTGLTGASLDCAVSLSWDDAPEADLGVWEVWRARGAEEFALLDTAISAAYTDSGLTNGETYRYRLVAVDVAGNESEPSEAVTVVPEDTSIPAAPTGLTATPQHEGALLDWDNAPESDVFRWEVWRAEGSIGYSKVADVTSSVFDESGLKSRVKYTYAVLAVDDDGNYGPPTLVQVVPLDLAAPAGPTGLFGTAHGGRVDLGWNAAPETDVTGWEVWRSTSGSPYSKIGTAASPFYSDVNVDNTVSYGYRIVARDASENASKPSSSITAVPIADVSRLQGANRYATAVAVSKSTFAPGVETIVLATGETFPDALSASALAGCYRGPLLLTPSAKLGYGVDNEFERLHAKKVVIVGGTSAVSSAVERELASAGYAVSRISGRDRYETAAKVALEVKRLGGGGRVFVARGDTFPDALSASPAAYAKRYPVLLVQSGAIPTVTRNAIDALKPTEAVVLGSSGAVSESVKRSLGVLAIRWGGSTRYETSAIIATQSAAAGWTSFGAVGIATGASFPDALGGGAAIGARGGVLLLTPGSTLSANASNAIRGKVRDIDTAFVVGGTGAVSSGVEKTVRGLLGL